MDSGRFDGLVRTLFGGTVTRRSLARLAAGFGIGAAVQAVTGSLGAEAACAPAGQTCSTGHQ